MTAPGRLVSGRAGAGLPAAGCYSLSQLCLKRVTQCLNRDGQLQLMGQSQHLAVFVNRFLLTNTANVCLHIVGGCFPLLAAAADLSCWGGDHVAHKAED